MILSILLFIAAWYLVGLLTVVLIQISDWCTHGYEISIDQSDLVISTFGPFLTICLLWELILMFAAKLKPSFPIVILKARKPKAKP